MTTFDERDKNFENKFAHDEEIEFKVHARCNKLLGLWAAAKMGKTANEAEAYARDIVLREFERMNKDDIVGKLLNDFKLAHVDITSKEIKREMERLLPIARKEIKGEAS